MCAAGGHGHSHGGGGHGHSHGGGGKKKAVKEQTTLQPHQPGAGYGSVNHDDHGSGGGHGHSHGGSGSGSGGGHGHSHGDKAKGGKKEKGHGHGHGGESISVKVCVVRLLLWLCICAPPPWTLTRVVPLRAIECLHSRCWRLGAKHWSHDCSRTDLVQPGVAHCRSDLHLYLFHLGALYNPANHEPGAATELPRHCPLQTASHTECCCNRV